MYHSQAVSISGFVVQQVPSTHVWFVANSSASAQIAGRKQHMTDYKSSVLTCYDGDPNCPCCRFIDGARDAETMLHVIGVLDTALADAEKSEGKLIDQVCELSYELDWIEHS